MKIPFINLNFFFEKNEVGVFHGLKYPTMDGVHRYEPYRGIGHYEMWKTIKEKDFSICYYINRSEKVLFKVEDSGKYRKLILTEFRKENI